MRDAPENRYRRSDGSEGSDMGSGASDAPATGRKNVFGRLWAGEVPLAQAFWTYAVLYGLLANLATTAASFALFANEAPTAVALPVYFLALPYNILVTVAVWRSAGRFEGPRHWADLARIAVIVWVVTLTVV